ncbi:MAG: ATP-binding cassette subfamily B [Geobacteraceae bacterium]|nr:MAG: ATP-binding cassette subfamily B [Geobacteraceae bacterium]
MSGWHIVRSYIYQNRLVYFSGVTLVVVGSLFAVLIPRLLGRFADRLQHGSLNISETASCAGLIIVFGIIRVSTGWTGRILVHRKGRILAYQLRRELFRKWGTLSPGYYHRHSTGDLLSHALSDVEVVRDVASMGINMSTSGLSMLAAAFYMMAVHVDWRLTLAALGPLVVIPALVRWLGPKIRHQSQRSQEALGSMAQTVEEVIGGIRAVKAFGNERVVIGRFEQKVDVIVAEKMRFVRLSALFGSLVPLMANLGFIMVLGYGGFLAIKSVITLGDFVAFTLYVAMLRMPLEQLGSVLNVIQRASASLNRISELLRVVPAVGNREGPLLDRPIHGDLRVERLTFRYPGTERNVLSDVSFTVRPGRTVGIIGSMGSGKTTLADVLLRLYDPPEGTVFIDGADILRYPLARLRQGIAYVPQDGFLFSTTLLENIGFSDERPDREWAQQSARITAVYDNIERFPEGFETEIGERGVRLSGGQKQRVAIARMIYKDAYIQILDDSLSAVDTKTERMILKNMRENGRLKGCSRGGGKTTIIVSHRLSAVQHADEILVLEEGRVIERGNHAGLIMLGGSYARLWSMQSGLTEEEAASLQTGLAVRVDTMHTGLAEEMEAMGSGLTEGVA